VADSADDQPDPASTLAGKLDRLFTTVPNPATGRPYSHEDVADALAAAGGPTISATYIWQLRRGQRTNPRMSHLEALARHFGVDPAYFFPGDLTAEVADRMTAAAELRDHRALGIARAAAGLGHGSLDVVATVVAHLRHLEGRTPAGA
jgi:transcriptional regulator with XRE-family HTH domain